MVISYEARCLLSLVSQFFRRLAASTLVTSVCRVDVSDDMTYGVAMKVLFIYFVFIYIPILL